MSEKIIIREGRKEDYFGLKKMEEKAWKDTGVEIISEKMFLAWLEIFPKGLRIAEKYGRICGHIFVQICDFNPKDENDNRNWAEMTDNGYSKQTHNIYGNCIYVVSVSAIYPGAGKLLINETILLTDRMFKQYYAGACRMPGLIRYARKKELNLLNEKIVSNYAQLVSDSVKGNRPGKEKLVDPVITTILSLKKAKYSHIIRNYFSDKESLNWGCVIYYENELY